jgi:hypothetical protein
MSLCVANTNPLYNSYFQLIFGRGTNQMELMCQKVNLPGIAIPDQPQPTRLSTQIPIPTMVTNFELLSVEFVVDSELSNWLSLYSWIRNFSNIENDVEHSLQYQDWHHQANLYIFDSATRCEILHATFHYIIPIKLSGMNFQADSADVLLQKATCSFKYSFYNLKNRFNEDAVPSNLHPSGIIL